MRSLHDAAHGPAAKRAPVPASGSHGLLFGHADVGHFGLAHSLLAWARCRLWCDRHAVPMLAPSWLQPRVGPFLRGERDKRQYHLLFEFGDYVRGLRKLRVLAGATRVVAETADLEAVLRIPQRQLVIFSNRMQLNEESHFGEIVGQADTVRLALTRMTKPAYRPPTDSMTHVAVHVRMGDFNAPPSIDALRQGSKNSRIPIDWYVDVVNTLRARAGVGAVRVYSDGSDEALAPLLQLPDTTRSPKQASITDLLAMAKSRVVVSSGSGFSMWGAYLGNSPRICFRGQRFARVLPSPEGTDVDLEPECEAGQELPDAFMRAVGSRLAAA